MSVPCPTCIPLDCDSLADTDLYSIEQPLFPFVLECPPGFDCGTGDHFEMVCCGQLMSVQFPANATVDDKQTLIQELVNQCGVRMAFCGGGLPQKLPNNPVILFQNTPQQCTVYCPDGSPFVYTVAAGIFAATTQAEADANAANYACAQANLRKVCLGSIPGCACINVALSMTISHSGGIPPLIWLIVAGSLPAGLTMNLNGLITGTPTVRGTYMFTVRVQEPDGSFMTKTYRLSILEITTTVLDAYYVGVPYSFQLQAAGGSGNYRWKIASGSLPAGLTMDVNGLITGTPQ